MQLVPENIINNMSSLPFRYRSMEELQHAPNLSGSGRFTVKQITKVRDLHPDKQVWVIDLRRESHYISKNGNPYSFYGGRNDDNADKPWNTAEYYEQQKNPDPDHYRYERDAIQSLGMKYLRLPITDHIEPPEGWMSRFLGEMSRIPKGDWIHVHCRGGVGRTTTVMTMIDMYRNRHFYTFEEYLDRQVENGGKDLRALPDKTHWKYNHHVKRLEYIRQFYQEHLYDTFF